MANYHWDLAFSWNQNERASNNYYLQNNFVNVSTTPPTVGLPIGLQINDTVAFCLFDVTTPNAKSSPYVLTSSNIQFSAMLGGQSANSPFGSSVTPAFPSNQSSQSSGTSTIFSGGTSTVFPAWTGNATYSITTNGWYEMTVSIEMTDPISGNSMTFVCDPEMIVGGIG